MIGYIKDRRTFDTAATVNISDYSLPGSCTIKNDGKTYTGSWLVVDNEIYYISRSTPKNDELLLEASDAINAFFRPVKMPENARTYGAILGQVLASDFRDGGGDAYYSMPYLDIESTDTTAADIETDDYGYITPSSVMQSARNSGVSIVFSLAQKSKALRIGIETGNLQTVNILLGDGHSILETESYSSGAVAKVTVVTEDVRTDYYLSADHHMSTTPPEKRADGDWNVYFATADEDTEAVARGAFSGNAERHKVEFTSDKPIRLGQPVKIRYENGNIFDAAVTKITRRMRSEKPLYQCGNLATTLTEKVAAAGIPARKPISGGGGAAVNPYPVGSIYMSVNGVSPVEIFGGSWEQIQGRFLLASSAAYPAGATGGEENHTLTVEEMPSHKHDVKTGLRHSDGTSYSGEYVNTTLAAGSARMRYSNYCANTGGGQAHNNMPPYLSVNMWVRTA